MKLNLDITNIWIDKNSDSNQRLDATKAPFNYNYFLFAESLSQPLVEIISERPESLYQVLSSRCIWISTEVPFSNSMMSDGGMNWELCKGTDYRPIKPDLITFDMDSTLISEEVIDEIARDAGCYQQVAEVTELAMQGELDFNQSLIKRVSLIKGLSVHRLDAIAERLNLSNGALSLLNCLHQQQIKTAILSGGFDFFADKIAAKLGIETIHSNKLEVVSGYLSGNVVGEIVNAEMKAHYLLEIATQHTYDLSSTMAVGDGANDLKVLQASGLGVAWHAKPSVAAQADVAINRLGLDVISWLWC